ncbi:hypothetical protein COL940_013045 [Colletotrichum noveboracense]|nr:hypothetical protein COL940_013045 [Colletotrichum noveboracense]
MDMEEFDVLATVTDITGRRTLVYTGTKGDTMAFMTPLLAAHLDYSACARRKGKLLTNYTGSSRE